jgi:hypothetical protein
VATRAAVEKVAEQPEVKKTLERLDENAKYADECDHLKTRFDPSGSRSCPPHHDVTAWREQAEQRISALDAKQTNEAEDELASTLSNSLPYGELHRQALDDSAIDSADSASDAIRAPSGEVKYVIEQAVKAVYDHGLKAAVEAAIGKPDGLAEIFNRGLIGPFVDVLVHDTVKNAVGRAAQDLAFSSPSEAGRVTQQLGKEVVSLPQLSAADAAAAAAVANILASAPPPYLLSLRQKEAMAEKQEKAERVADEKRQQAAEKAERAAEVRVGELAHELYRSNLYIRGDLTAEAHSTALDFVPSSHLLSSSTKESPSDAIIIDGGLLTSAQLVSKIRRRAPSIYAAQKELAKQLFLAGILASGNTGPFIEHPDLGVREYRSNELKTFLYSPQASAGLAPGTETNHPEHGPAECDRLLTQRQADAVGRRELVEEPRIEAPPHFFAR